MRRLSQIASLLVLLGLPVLVAMGAAQLATRWGDALGGALAARLSIQASTVAAREDEGDDEGEADEDEDEGEGETAAGDGSSENLPSLLGLASMPSIDDSAFGDAAGANANANAAAEGQGQGPHGASGATHGARARARTKPAPSRGIYVRQERVLECVRRGARPDGRAISPRGHRPGGVLLSGVAALGIGLEDGDVLTEVEGRPVRHPGEVVGLVLGARARHAPVISGRIFRGGQSFDLAVEQPYPGRATAAKPKGSRSTRRAPKRG